MVLSVIYKALKNVMDAPPFLVGVRVAAIIGIVTGWDAGWAIRRDRAQAARWPYVYVERMFGRLQIATACFVAFAHGANDVANAVGPLAAVVDLHRQGFAVISTQVAVPTWVLVMGGAGIVLGLATLGYG